MPPAFGQWMMTLGEKAHYFLEGEAICGCKAVECPEKKIPIDPMNRTPVLGVCCTACAKKVFEKHAHEFH